MAHGPPFSFELKDSVAHVEVVYEVDVNPEVLFQAAYDVVNISRIIHVETPMTSVEFVKAGAEYDMDMSFADGRTWHYDLRSATDGAWEFNIHTTGWFLVSHTPLRVALRDALLAMVGRFGITSVEVSF
jgi:hypothetical protein